MPLPVPQSKVDIDPNFEAQLRALQEHAALAGEALRSGGQVPWCRPAGWAVLDPADPDYNPLDLGGDPFDYAAIHAAFQRDAANEQFLEALSAETPGVSADLMAATLMIDYLGALERSFKQRMTMTRARRYAQAAGRQQGHGSTAGVHIGGTLEYLRRLVQRAKAGG